MNENIFNPNYGVEKPAETASLPPIVSLKDIYQHYDTGETVFKDFNLSIPDIPEKGQFITLMGQSGCGKSTILRYISGLQSPISGTILFKGQPRDRKNSVPMVFQQYTNLEWKTVLENVRLPLDINNVNREEANEKAMEILKVVGLETHADQYAKYPLLSGGQLQRVAIARGLIMNPEILLMDEPFGALDVKTRQDMQLFLRTIFENQEDMTIILVTHSISEAILLSDKVFVLGNKPAEVVRALDINLGYERTEEVEVEYSIGKSPEKIKLKKIKFKDEVMGDKFKEYENELRSALEL